MVYDLELPGELVNRPLALVGLTGLNTEANSIHQLIWNSFTSTNRTERPPLNFRLIDSNHSFQPAKADRTSYEWYIPKGILKRKWIYKHLNEIPGVLALFYDLEWDDPQWRSKHLECSKQLQNLRSCLIGRGTKLVLVLLQNSAPLPSAEDALAADRAAALCQACDLPPKSLFVLPCRSDHLQGYTLRLESAFYELCQSSYHQSSRAVRTHRDQLNRTNHGYLYVRHQFKMGFYNEMKQDVAMAHKHYSQAYAHVLELRITDANVNEVKIVAGYIAYKVWKLSFMLNLPREAIAHFKSHVDFFRLRTGHPLTRFEHNAWLATQFSVFGCLFEEAIELGLPAIQSLHPGYYYQQASQHAINRKKACYQDYDSLDRQNVGHCIEYDYSKLEFYGQRPWRPNRLSLEPSDLKAEMEGITNLLIGERQRTNHTTVIVGLLTSAVNQFKNYRSPRMKQFLLVQMAEEYSRSSNYNEALTLLESLLWEYRKDYWWSTLTSLLRLCLRCAYLSGRIAEYFTSAIELCSENTINDLDDKKRIFTNMIGILDKRIPPPEPDLHIESAEVLEALWTSELEKSTANRCCITNIITNTVSTFVEIKSSFTKRQFYAEQPIDLCVVIRYTGPVTITFSGLNVALNNPAYSPFCQIKGENSSQLKFEPGQTRRFDFKFPADAQDIGGELQITSITLQMGHNLVAYLRCEGSISEEFACSATRAEFPSAKCRRAFENVALYAPAEILPRTAKVEMLLVHEPPALRGECYPLIVKLVNKEVVDISQVDLTVTCSKGRVHLQPKIDTENCGSSVRLFSPTISSSRDYAWTIYIQIEQPGTHDITFQVDYQVQNEVCQTTQTYQSRLTETINLETIQPIECESQFQTLQFQPLSKVPTGETFVAIVNLSNMAPFPIVLDEGAWKFNVEAGIETQSFKSNLSELVLEPKEKCNDIALMQLSGASDSNLLPGSYSIKWKRSSYRPELAHAKIPYSVCFFELPEIPAVDIPLRIETQLPAHGFVREPLNAIMILRNTSEFSMELDISMDSNDAFMFSGNKQIKIQIYPGDKYKLIYNLYPLLSGYVALPPLRLNCIGGKQAEEKLNQEVLSELLNRQLPTHIYVLPQAKKTGRSM